MQRTFSMLKPDAVRRGLVGEVVARIERKGLRIAALKMIQMPQEKAEALYEEHKGKPFYDNLMSFIMSGPVVVMVIEGDDVIGHVRNIMGATDPAKATPGSIRGDYATFITHNIIHGCDSLEKAEREIGIFFNDNEIC
jgi:nucleoside-diphosphate kinase